MRQSTEVPGKPETVVFEFCAVDHGVMILKIYELPYAMEPTLPITVSAAVGSV